MPTTTNAYIRVNVCVSFLAVGSFGAGAIVRQGAPAKTVAENAAHRRFVFTFQRARFPGNNKPAAQTQAGWDDSTVESSLPDSLQLAK
jgi:hypothetical protein